MEVLRASYLPPGFGFHPTDVELISHYLKKKILGQKIEYEIITEVDIYKHEPWDLPAKCHVPTRDSKWHFFASRDRKYPNGSRKNRATEAGYWKSTGKDRNIRSHDRVIGTKKTLVFHEGRPPYGKRTDWIMHEYYMDENECKTSPGVKDAYVLCRVTKRNALEEENVQPQTEDADACQKQPKDVGISAVPGESSPSENVEDIEAWFSELFDPNFPAPTLTEIKSEPQTSQEGLSSFAPKEEPEYSNFVPEAEDPHYLLSDDIYSILQSDAHDFNSDVFGELGMAVFDPINNQFPTMDSHHEINLLELNNEEISSAVDPNIDTGITVRERRTKPSTEVLKHKIRLQVSKMESRNGQSISQTVKISNRGLHLDPTGENHFNAESRTLSTASGKNNIFSKDITLQKRSVGSVKATILVGNADDSGCFKRFLTGLCNVSRWCSSASMKCFVMSACMMGTAALISYFVLRDAHRFLGSTSVLEL